MPALTSFIRGVTVGTGAAINVSTGFIPDRVTVTNVTDGDKVTIGFPSIRSIAFTSGGTYPIAVGDTITGATSRAQAVVLGVNVTSGTFAGGDAAGFLFIDVDSLSGAFGTENVFAANSGTRDDAAVSAAVAWSVDYDTEVASATGNAAISAFVGTTTAAKGFTIGSTVSESGKILMWQAERAIA